MLKARWNDDVQSVVDKVRGTRVEVKWGELYERLKAGTSGLGR